MADNPTFNLKTGADSDIFVSREVTGSGTDSGKILTRSGVYRYPVLTRQTGNSFKGTIEKIESNEIRKGRVNSAPRLGSESSEGSQEVEFSPETFDDYLEAVFRGKWVAWESDTNSPSNKDKKTYAKGYFATQCGKNGARKLLDDGTGEGDALGVVKCVPGVVVHELNPGTEDIKYSQLMKFGGVTGEDLYQEYQHRAVNSMSLDVAVNAIVTGSFDFIGGNQPKLLGDGDIKTHLDGRFADAGMSGEKMISNLPEKASGTMQFTAREGFLYVGGNRVRHGNALSFSLDNGLEKKYAIFEQQAIASTPMTLDITGELTEYLVAGKSDIQFNKAVADETVELLFCLQDKVEDPENLYVFQIFKTKLDSSVSMNGEDTVDISHSYSSFDEEACRVFRIMLPRSVRMTMEDDNLDGEPDHLVVLPNVELAEGFSLDDLTVTASIGSVDKTADLAFTPPELVVNELDDRYGCVVVGFTPVAKTADEQVVDVTVSWRGKDTTTSFIVKATGESTGEVPQVGPAPLADPSFGDYDVKGNFPVQLEKGQTYKLSLESVTPIQEHQNGNGDEGYWLGFRVNNDTPGAKEFHYRKDLGSNFDVLDGLGWQKANIEKNVDGNGSDGVAFYFDKAVVGDKKAYVALRFGDTPEGQEYKFEVDFSRVKTA